MRWAEWAEIAEWMIPRWPQMADWEEEEWSAMWDDLSPYRAEDVARAVRALHPKREFPPRSGAVLRWLREYGVLPERALKARESRTVTGDPTPWEDVASELGYEGMSVWEYVKAVHGLREQEPDEEDSDGEPDRRVAAAARGAAPDD